MDRHKVVVEYSADVANYAANARKLRAEIEMLNASILRSRAVSSEAMAGLTTDFNKNLKGMSAWSTEAIAMDSAGRRLGKSIDANRLTMQRQKQLLKEYRQGAVGARGAISELAKEQVRMSRSQVNFYDDAQGRRMASVSTPGGIDMKQRATQIAVAREEMKAYNRVLAQNAEATVNWGKNTQWAGRQIMVGMTIPLLMMGAAAKNVFIDMDKELTRLGKVYGGNIQGATDQAVAQIKAGVTDLSQELAASWGVSAKDTMGLAADVAATGKEGNDLLVSTREAMRLSVLGEVDRQEALKATLSLQSAFKLSNLELVDSVNLLNAVENQTSTSLEDLSIAIPKAGPVVKALGGDVGDLAAMLVAMKEGGIQAAEGANAIKSGLASMINPTKQASAMAEGFGIDLEGIVTRNQGKLMPTMMEFQKSLMGLDEFKRAKLIETIFGKYQFARISALFENLNKEGSQSIEVFKLMAGSSEQLAQTADREMKRLTESTSMRWQRTVETFKANLAPLGEAITKVFTGVLNAVNIVLEAFDKLPAPVKSFIGILGGVAALVGPILMIAGIFGNFVGQLMKGFAILRGKKSGMFELLTKDIVAANAATGHLVDAQFNEKAALAEINSVMEQQIKLLRELTAAKQAAAAPMPTPPVTPPPVPTGGQKVQRFSEAVASDYGKSARKRVPEHLEGAWLAGDQARAKAYTDSQAASKRAPLVAARAIDKAAAPIINSVGQETSRILAKQISDNGVIDPKALDSELKNLFPEGKARDVARAVSTNLFHGLEVPLDQVPDDVRKEIEKRPLVNREGYGSLSKEIMAQAAAVGVTPTRAQGGIDMGHMKDHSGSESETMTTASQIPQQREMNRGIGQRALTDKEIARDIIASAEMHAAVAYATQEAASAAPGARSKKGTLLESAAAAKSPTMSKYIDSLDASQKAMFEDFRKQFGEGSISMQKLHDDLVRLGGASETTAAAVVGEIAASDKSAKATERVAAAEAKLATARKGVQDARAGGSQKDIDAARVQVKAAEHQLKAAQQAERAARVNVKAADTETRTAQTNTRAADTQNVAAKTQQAAAAGDAGTAGGPLPGQRGGRMKGFMNSAEGQTMGIGMGAMGLGMLTGNEAMNQVGIAMSAVSMVAMGLNAVAGPVITRFNASMLAASAAATRFAASASAGGIAGVGGKFKMLGAGLGRFLTTAINPATIGLAAAGAAAYGMYKVWDNARKREESRKRNDRRDTELFGSTTTKYSQWAAGAKNGTNVDPRASDEIQAIKDSETFKEILKDIKVDGKQAQNLETRYRANSASAQASVNGTSEEAVKERAAKQAEVDKYFELVALESGVLDQWAAIKYRQQEATTGVQATQVESLTAAGAAAKEYQDILNEMDAIDERTNRQPKGADAERLAALEARKIAIDVEFGFGATGSSLDDVEKNFQATSKAIGTGMADAIQAGATKGQAAIGMLKNAMDFTHLQQLNPEFASIDELKSGIESVDKDLFNTIKDFDDINDIVMMIATNIGAIPPEVAVNIQLNHQYEADGGAGAMAQWIADAEAGQKAMQDEVGRTKVLFDSTAANSAQSVEEIGEAYDNNIDKIEDAGKAAERAHKAEQQASQDRQDALKEEIEGKQEKIEKIQETIDKIDEEAEKDKEAFERAKAADDFDRDRRKSEIDYYDALARGDYVGAAGIRSDMEQAGADRQNELAVQSIDDTAEAKKSKEQKKIDKIETQIDALNKQIDAIGKVQEASDRAFDKAQEQRQIRVEQMREDRDAYVKAEKKKADTTASREKKARDEAWSTYTTRMAAIEKLAINGKISEEQVKTRTKAAADAISKTMGWSPAKTAEFANNMSENLINAYASVLKKAGITQEDLRKMTGRKVVYDNEGNASFTNVPINHKGAYVNSDHTSGKGGIRGDEVHRVLQRGEYVVRKEAVSKYGRGHLEKINSMKMHTGGAVGDMGPAGLIQQAGVLTRQRVAGNIQNYAKKNIFQPMANKMKAAKDAQWAGGRGDAMPAPSGPIPPGARAKIMARGASALGIPYSWGGGGTNGPSNGIAQGAGTVGFDCSGLVQFAAAAAKINMPRLADTQMRVSKSVSASAAQPGDVVGFTEPGASAAHHIGLVAGKGVMLHAPYTGSTVRYGAIGHEGQKIQYGSLPGLAKGAFIEKNNVLANLHKGETVLTSRLSEGLKKGIEGMSARPGTIDRGNAGSTVNEGDKQINVNVYAQPGMDVDDLANEMERRVERAAARVGVWS